MLRGLRIVVSVAVLLAAAAAPSFGWKFASIADSRGTDNGVNAVEFALIIGRINLEGVDLVIFQGDAVNGCDDACLISQMDTWLSLMNGLNCSWYYSPGNHEISTSTSENVLRAKVDQPLNGPPGHEEMVYSFDHENAHFVSLNSNHYGEVHKVQKSWLAADLASTDKPHIFVMAHEPAYPKGPHIGGSLDAYPGERDDFWNIMTNAGVEIYFCGHEHLYARSTHGGICQIINGTCGAPISGGVPGTIAQYHYVIVQIDGYNVHGEAKNDTGGVLDSWNYTAGPPNAAISAPSATLTRTGPVTYTVTWSEDVIGFTSGDITLDKTGSANAAVGLSGSGSSYTVTLSSCAGSGTLGITIPAGCCTDITGNANTASSPSATFVVDNTAPATTASPTGGTYTSPQSVALTPNETATIYYTTDGSEPTTGSSVYSAPVQINITTTLRFFAVDTAGNEESPKKQEEYAICDPSLRVSSVKSLADGTSVTLCEKVLYLKRGYMAYIEEQDRSSGIRLQGEIPASEDQLISLSGTMGTTPDGERYILVGTITPGGSHTARPLGVNNRDLKRSLMEGLYVTTWGRVKEGSVTGESFVLADGSDSTGITVSTPGDPGVSEGQYVTVSGAAGYEGLRVVYKR